MSDASLALRRVLDSDLPDAERAKIEARVAAGDAPADILADVDGVLLLEATAGAHALAEDEADDLFDAILAQVDGAESETPVVAAPEHAPAPKPANNNRGWIMGLALAAAALLVAVPLMTPEDPYTGLKGDGGLDAPEFRVFEGDGQGGVSRELHDGDAVAVGTPVVFRYHTEHQATALLLVDESGASSNPWTSAVQGPGEFEVLSNGTTLAYVIDQPVTFGLRLLSADDTLKSQEFDKACATDVPCARFTLTVAPN